VNTFLQVLLTFRELLKVALLWAAIIVAVVAVTDWLVRTRRISPFGVIGRFFRQRIDPLLEPVERRVIRAGGMPANAPWWALAAVAVVGILLLALLDFLAGLFVDIATATSSGTVGIVRLVIFWTFMILRIALLVRVIASWLPVSPYSVWLRWSFVLSEPLLRPLRSVIPPFRSIDLTPLVAFFGLGIAESLVRGWLQ
jgi:YggT family protein